MTTTPDDSSVAQGTATTHSVAQIFRRHPEIWIALVLWVASNAFVTEISKFATWEGSASYYSSADLCRWDCGWFATVLEGGYDAAPLRAPGDTANWLFHPGLPLSAYPFHYWLKLSLPVSLVMASKSALLFAIYAFLLMLRDQTISTADRFRAGSLVAFNPYIIYAHAGYSEPLYFALLAFAFYFATRGQWIVSGIMGAVLSASRLIGFLFTLPYAMVAVRDSGWRSGWRKVDLNRIIGLLLCPLGTAIYMLHLHNRTGDALAQVHVHVAWLGTPPGDPFHVLWLCLTGHHWPRIWGMMALAGLFASVWLFVLRKSELGVYLALSILIALSGGYHGMPRYIWWQPPLLYAIYCLLKHHRAWWVVYVAFASGMASFMIMEWFSGHNFVV